MIDPVETSPAQAADVMARLDRAQQATRRRMGVPWFPLVCFGVLYVVSAPLVAAAGTGTLAPYWLTAGSLGMLAVRRHYQGRAARGGVTGRVRPISALTIGGSALTFAVGLAGGILVGASAGLVGPILAVFTAYVALGYLLHDSRPVLAVAPATGVGLALAAGDQQAWLVELTFGVGMLLGGVALRWAGGRT